MTKLSIFLMLLISLIFVNTWSLATASSKEEKTVSSEECISKKGRIVTFGGCTNDEESIGNVSGVRCICVCCVPKK